MRLHRLAMTAFGPFAGSEKVDFDELCDAGLFLLTGPTGAGKTTVLDAVCFALYGSVPGVRGVKALKSHHAAAQARPEVTLEFSVRDRRFLVRRTPEWTRPKRRGEGFTTENASATLVERTSGEDHLLSSRAQEVGHFIGDLIGMQATQFVQVAMLPQGDFQRFLRASSQDRHDVLQHLFRTDRYARIEEWVHDHSRGLKERSLTEQHTVLRVLDTIADRTGVQLPEEITNESLQATASQEHACSWADGLIEAAEGCRTTARDQLEAAASAVARARAEQDEAVKLCDLHQRRDRALATLDELAAGADREQEARTALAADTSSARCAPLLGMLDEAHQRRTTLSLTWSAAATELAELERDGFTLPDQVSAAGLAVLEQQARSKAVRLEALLPREQRLREARAAATTAESELAAVTDEQERLAERSAGLPAALDEAEARVAAAGAVAARTDALALELGQARRCLEAAEAARSCEDDLPTLEDAERDARDRAADLRDRVQELTARRLAGIAGELAAQLVDGSPCQVCGSTDHPAAAAASAVAVTEAAQNQATADYDAAAADHAAANAQVLRARERLAGLRTASGGRGAGDVAADVARLTEALREAERGRTDLEEAESRVGSLRAESDAVAARAHHLAVRSATLAQTVESHRRTVDDITVELACELQPDHSLAEQVSHLGALAEALGRAHQTLCDLEEAAVRVEDLQARVGESARELGFPDVDALRAAALDADDRERLEELLESRKRAAARAAAVLEDEAVVSLGDSPPPDVEAVAATTSALESVQRSAARALDQQAETVSALRRLRERLQGTLDQWHPLLTEHLRAESMSKLVRGMGGDNQLQMRLSAYVLATRLDQVLAAANTRLAHMRDQRYLLQRTDRAARKGAQAGLGLEVVDQWTGDVRDPATLSGGETFVVSLALALGLADVVTQEAGGTEVETLFVDEGFGTLDADTLDDVMDRLDDLRAGGRAVGVVSHVSELRNRIPTQLHVDKRRTGSVVTVRTAVG
jgi:exonuclease SbcC